MAYNQLGLEVQREHINQLFQQLTAEYSTLKSEIQQINERYPGSDDEFSFSEDLELLIVDVSGYANQIKATGNVAQSDLAVSHLYQVQIFADGEIARFYEEAEQQYPKVQAYLQRLDYLRLLMAEYLQMQHTIQPISV
jgi:hypothetical protein